ARQALARQQVELQRQILQLEQALAELPSQRAARAATASRELALLHQERIRNKAAGALLLSSPVAGLVANSQVEPGQSVEAGQTLMSLLPAGSRLQARLMVPSSAVGFIGPGDRVLLRYRAFPYQRFGQHEGVVARV